MGKDILAEQPENHDLPPLRKADIAALEKVFYHEINRAILKRPYLPFQSRAKAFAKLADQGYLERRSVTIRGRPPLMIEGFELIENLRILWGTPLSAKQIGDELGLSKSAVIGKAHRLCLPTRPSPIKRDPSAAPKPRQAQRAPILLPSLAIAEDLRLPEPKPEDYVRRACWWPSGNSPKITFSCDKPRLFDRFRGIYRQYCAAHHKIAFVPMRHTD